MSPSLAIRRMPQQSIARWVLIVCVGLSSAVRPTAADEPADVGSSLRVAQNGASPSPLAESEPLLPATAVEAATTDEALPSPFGPDHVRTNLLGPGDRPQPSEAVQRKLDRFVEAQLDAEAQLILSLGLPRLLVFKQVPKRIQIADEEVASYTLVTDRELSLVGKKLGVTMLNLWFTDPNDAEKQIILSYLVDVQTDPRRKARMDEVLKGLETELNRNFPDSSVRLSFVGDRVLVRGQAKDIEDATQIIRIVGGSVPEPKDVGVDRTQTPAAQTTVNYGESLDAQNVYAEYKLQNEAERQSLQGNGNVINMLRIAGVHQVMLKVTVAEIDRSATQALGANLTIGTVGFSPARFTGFFPTAAGAAQTAAAATTGAITGVTSGGVGTGGNFLVNEGDFRLVINALKQLDLARTLNEPNLTALNGRPATLQVGGSFPIPQTTTQGVGVQTFQSVEYVPFGVMLRFIPTIVDKDRVRLQVFANVSDPGTRTVNVGGTTTAGGTTSGGTNVPANVDTRNFNTVVELREGQCLAAAGLLKTVYTSQAQRVPVAGDVPIVGRLFANDRTFYSERELVILVTPYLVSPYEEHEAPPLPGSDVHEPSDMEFFVLGRIEGCRSEDYRSAVRSDWQKMQAFRRCQQTYIVGPSGHSDGRP